MRGAAYLLLHRDAEAEKEFAGLRDSVAPVLGDYVANQTVEFHRMQAAFYGGRYDRVIQMWPRLPRSWWTLYALDVGRAYLQGGMLAEAEHHLRLARKAQQAYFMNGDMQAQHNLLTWMLAQFYLAQVLDKSRRPTEAIAHYQDFVKHFEKSSPPLPQIAAARAALSRVQFSERGKLLFSDEFSGNRFGPGWKDAGQPGAGNRDRRWLGYRLDTPRRGGIGGTQPPHRLSQCNIRILVPDRGPRQISLSLDHKDRTLARLYLNPKAMVLRAIQPSEQDGSAMVTLERLEIAIEAGNWHKVVVEVLGKRIIAQLDDKLTVSGKMAALDIDKTGFALSVDAANASFDYVRMYEVLPR